MQLREEGGEETEQRPNQPFKKEREERRTRTQLQVPSTTNMTSSLHLFFSFFPTTTGKVEIIPERKN